MAARHLKGVHATIIDSSTINDIIGGSRRGSDGLQSILDNIALAIYKEPLLQAAKDSSDEYLATPWTLCQPADGKGETLYLGIDVGTPRGQKSILQYAQPYTTPTAQCWALACSRAPKERN